MKEHRHPPTRVSNDVPAHNLDPFHPLTAVELLQIDIVQLEALANAATEAVVQIPFPSDREDRRPFDRLYALVTKVAEDSSALVRSGEGLVGALAEHMQGKHSPPD